MKRAIVFFFAVSCFFYTGLYPEERAVLVHNSLKEIDACKGKLNLKLVRVWGGDEEEDEKKFFKTPFSIKVDNYQSVYICDRHDHCVKVFDIYSKYIRTVGTYGQGPGDLNSPFSLDLYPNGDILVYEAGGRRFQWFDASGKSKKILKYNGGVMWFGINTRAEIAVYDIVKTFMKRKLISIIDSKGKVLKEFGKYHDKSKSFMAAEHLNFCIDKNDNIYAAYKGTPVIRKFSPEGRMIMAITFETPSEIPYEITLNSQGDEIDIKKEAIEESKYKVARMRDGVAIQKTSSDENDEFKYGICSAIAVDSKAHIYIVTIKRKLTEKEKSGLSIVGGNSFLNREHVDFDTARNIDAKKLLVFDSNGKILAEEPLSTFCNFLYIFNNRIFIVDGAYNQCIFEYEMFFKN